MALEARVPVVLLGDLTLLRPLVMAKIPVIVATADAADPTLKSRHALQHCLLPGLRGEASAESLALLVRLAEQIFAVHGVKPPLIYGSDECLAFIYRHREMIERHFSVVLNDTEVGEALLYKHTFGRLAKERGVRMPRTYGETLDLDEDLASASGPVIVKPRDKVQWDALRSALFGPHAKARVFTDARELLEHPAYPQYKHDLVVQELIPGGEDRLVSFHGYADERGALLSCFCGRKVRTFPSPNGESSLIELVVDERLVDHGQQVAAALGLKGAFKIDLIHDPRTDVFYTLEVNARFTLWHYLAAADGVNVPAIAYAYLVHGARPEPQPYLPRHQWLNLYRDYKSFRQQRAHGALDLPSWISSLRRRPRVFEAFAWDDPVPALSWLSGEAWKVFTSLSRRLRTKLLGPVEGTPQPWRSTAS